MVFKNSYLNYCKKCLNKGVHNILHYNLEEVAVMKFQNNEEQRGLIFNIQHFSIHDGPGVRTVVFFKGCNLLCKWCHNPESMSFSPQLFFYEEKCSGCSACINKCSCHILDFNSCHVWLHNKCKKCFRCCDTCYTGALTVVGSVVSVSNIMEQILSNKLYFTQSGGGVTFSGGECMLQPDFLLALLTECKENGIHTAIDTAGNVPFEFFEHIIPYTDLFLYDIKAINSDLHFKLTGENNELILSNFNKLYELGCNIIVRIPYIPGFNAEEVEYIGEFLLPYKLSKELLPCHTLGNSKYEALGIQENRLDNVSKNNPDIKRLQEKYGLI